MVNHPPHYTSHPSGIEVINITRYCSFDIGNAIKYILRHGHKGDARQDLEKALWYLNDHIYNIGGDDEAMQRAAYLNLMDFIGHEREHKTLPDELLSVLRFIGSQNYIDASRVLYSYLQVSD